MIDSFLKNSLILRMVIIAVLTFALLVPAFFIEFLVNDRQATRESAVTDVSRSWGGSQTLTGPILTVPYQEVTDNPKDGPRVTIRYMHFLPSTLNVRTTLIPEIRYRGIYEVGLYNARIAFDGEFPTPEPGMSGIRPERVLWNEAFVTLGISDLKGIRDTVDFSVCQALLPSEPGVVSNDVVESGITCKTPIANPSVKAPFSVSVNLNGSSELRFTPVGQVTHVAMESPWENPSFVGNFLPESRDVSGRGFQAQWRVLNMNRNFPQSWSGSRYKVAESSFGVRLFLPVDEYQKTSRTVKYAILFIGLTFVAFFLSEVIAKVTLHPVQYALIGFALVVFYVLLLSISEHTSFNLAYALSSVAVIALVASYARWITESGRIAVIITGVLALLYTFLFVTLQLEDFALLLGSVGLFVILGLVMYLTRKVDWFALGGINARASTPV